ncbi:MAG: AI-2E family transporter [Chitinophagales bacterium]|nr:AI-2E family transporter [Chitinophagales bacterium]
MNTFPRWLLVSIGIVFFIAFAWYFSNIVTYLLIAGILSFIGQPIVEFLSTRKIKKFTIPRSMAAILAMALMFFSTMIFLSVFIPLMTHEAKIISEIDTGQLLATLDAPIQRLEIFLRDIGMLQNDTLQNYLQERLKGLLTIANVSNILNSILGFTGDFFVLYASVTFILFFFLKEKNLFLRIILALAPEGKENQMENALNDSKRMLARYFRGILLQITIFSILIWVGLAIVGLSNAFLIAVLAGILNIIPYVGPLIAAVIGIVLGITTALPMELYPDMVWLTVKILAVFQVTQLIDNYLIQPFIFSNSVHAHPLEIFLVILAGGTSGGVFGMVLAVPAYTVLKVLAKEFLGDLKIVKELAGNNNS